VTKGTNRVDPNAPTPGASASATKGASSPPKKK
jgi:hypothetical protein